MFVLKQLSGDEVGRRIKGFVVCKSSRSNVCSPQIRDEEGLVNYHFQQRTL